MSGKLFLSLIGAGGIGMRWAHAVSKVKNVRLIAVVDPDLAKAKVIASQFEHCAAYGDWTSVLHDSKITAVIIATPHTFLAPITEAFLKSKKHVLVEKPAGTHSVAIKKNSAIANKNGVRYMIGFNHRFHPAFILARKLFVAGKIGQLQFIRARYGFGGRSGFEKEWRHMREVAGGGELLDQGIHMIDMVRSFFGDVASAVGFAESLYWKTSVDDNAMLILRSQKKQLASIHVSWSNWNPLHNFEMYGTEGYISIEGLGRKYGGTEKVIWGKRNEKNLDHPIERIFMCNPDADNSLVKELQEFIRAIKEKRDTIPSAVDGYEALKIVEKIYGKK